MSLRGRGTLEVKPSANPFFQSTSSDYGVNPFKKIEWTGDVDMSMHKPHNASSESFSFLYTRESDAIGDRVPKPEMPKDAILTKTEFLKKRREEFMTKIMDRTGDIHHEEVAVTSPPKLTAADMLAVYKHEPKLEDPRFLTTSNNYGKKAPTMATVVVERHSRKQGFSKSFNNCKPKNTAINTSISKSNVHPKLDPQFL